MDGDGNASCNGPNVLDKERNLMNEDPKWQGTVPQLVYPYYVLRTLCTPKLNKGGDLESALKYLLLKLTIVFLNSIQTPIYQCAD